MPCYLRLMRRGDVVQVTEIDHEAFPTGWPPPNYHREMENRLAHYVVACSDERQAEAPPVASKRGFSRLASVLGGLFSYNRWVGDGVPPTKELIVGFAGFWIMADEAHIISIAVRSEYLRQGMGELLLIALIDLAVELGASMITLEVRVSNTAAQQLYYKYGFIQVGRRRAYYVDNREDALIMSTEDIHSSSFKACLDRQRQAYCTRSGITDFLIIR
ncbi:MAG: ribosomal protein S18-alanine N-acetyltransferase [Chloroflexota bacterium]